VLTKVIDQLLTPVGLRSLAPGHPDYKPHYDGDLRSRDAALYDGTHLRTLMPNSCVPSSSLRQLL